MGHALGLLVGKRALRGASDVRASVRLSGPPDGSVWRTDQGDGEPVGVPVIGIDGLVTAARVHLENMSRSVEYDGASSTSGVGPPLRRSASDYRPRRDFARKQAAT